MGANVNADVKKKKKRLIQELKDIDSVADVVGLSESRWQKRYKVEQDLVGVYQWEEVYWSQRAHVSVVKRRGC